MISGSRWVGVFECSNFLRTNKYKYKYKIKTYNAPYVTRVIRRRGDDTRLGSIGNAKKMTFESTFKNTNRNTISNIMWQSIPDSGGRVFIATRC